MTLDDSFDKVGNNVIVKENIWLDSKYFWLSSLAATQKGKYAESICMEYLSNKFKKVCKEKSPPWDINADNKRIEVKLSMLNKSGLFKFLQIRPKDGYTDIALLAVTPESAQLYLMPKLKLLGLKPQHSGARGSKDSFYLGIKPEDLYNTYKKYIV